MWWSRAFLLIGVLGLGPMGCGFSPMYAKDNGSQSGINTDLAGVRIVQIKDRLGQKLRNALVQRITPQGEPADYGYTLTVILSSSASDLGYRRDSFATLGSLSMSANIILTSSGAGLLSGTATTVVNFDYLGPRYASVAMERDAEDRGITQLADDIRSQVAAALARYKANPTDIRYRRTNESDFIFQSLQANRPEGQAEPEGRPGGGMGLR